MAREKILVVDDEQDILDLVSYNLKKEGYNVVAVTSGEEAISAARSASPDLVLLDLMLPGVDGLEVCKTLKYDPQTNRIPIIMITAKGEESDIITGLELGADDYIAKPFSPKVLIARVRAVLRRKSPENKTSDQEILRYADLMIDPGKHQVLFEEDNINLTVSEFRLLYSLAKHPGWVFTRHQIVELLRGDDYPVTERSVDVQVVGLRKKLGHGGAFIETVRGVGYRFREL